jgi:hypothetical protein
MGGAGMEQEFFLRRPEGVAIVALLKFLRRDARDQFPAGPERRARSFAVEVVEVKPLAIVQLETQVSCGKLNEL